MKSIKSYSRLLLILSGLTACAAGFFLFYHNNTGESVALFILSIILMTVVCLMTGYEIYSAMHNDSLDQSQIEQSNSSQTEIRTEIDETPEAEIIELDQTKTTMEIITEKDDTESDLTLSGDPDESKNTDTGSVSVEIIQVDDMSNNSDTNDTNDLHPESLEVSSVEIQSELHTEETPSIESSTEEDQDSEIDLKNIPTSILPVVSNLKSKNPLKLLLGNKKKHNLNNVYYGDWIELEDSYGIFSDLKEINVENRQTNISKLVGGEVLKYDFYIWEGHPAVHLLNNKESLGVLPKALSNQLWELKDHIDRISVKNIRNAKVKQISVNISLNLSAKTKLIEMFGDQVSESTIKSK